MDIDTEKLFSYQGRIRLVAVDVDGTLLNTSRVIIPKTLRVLKSLRDQGVSIVLVTGRSLPGVMPLYKIIEAHAPIVCFNGARVVMGDTGEQISSTLLDGKIVIKAVELARKRNIHIQVFQEDEFFYEQVREEARAYEEHTNLKGIPASFDTLPSLDALKLLCIAEHECLEKFAAQMRSYWNDRVYQVFSFPHYLEIMDSKVSKSRGLAEVCSRLGIASDEVIAFGDGENDIDMLQFAGVGVAMGNAPDAVKAAAGYVTRTNDQEGLAWFIEEHRTLFCAG